MILSGLLKRFIVYIVVIASVFSSVTVNKVNVTETVDEVAVLEAEVKETVIIDDSVVIENVTEDDFEEEISEVIINKQEHEELVEVETEPVESIQEEVVVEDSKKKENATDPEIKTEKMEEIVYATSEVNVRIGPGTEYEKIGVLEWGDSVTRIGKSSNDWSKVIYDNHEAYVSSKYLSTSKPKATNGSAPSDEIQNRMDSNSNLFGVLYIPSVGMSPMDVYIVKNSSDQQKYADWSGSGYVTALYDYSNYNTRRLEIGDHNTQNFSVLKNVSVGTIAYLNRGEQVVKLRCISSRYSVERPKYNAEIVNDDNTFAMICCAPNGTRTICKFVIDSGAYFDDLWNEAARYFSGHRNSSSAPAPEIDMTLPKPTKPKNDDKEEKIEIELEDDEIVIVVPEKKEPEKEVEEEKKPEVEQKPEVQPEPVPEPTPEPKPTEPAKEEPKREPPKVDIGKMIDIINNQKSTDGEDATEQSSAE